MLIEKKALGYLGASVIVNRTQFTRKLANKDSVYLYRFFSLTFLWYILNYGMNLMME